MSEKVVALLLDRLSFLAFSSFLLGEKDGTLVFLPIGEVAKVPIRLLVEALVTGYIIGFVVDVVVKNLKIFVFE